MVVGVGWTQRSKKNSVNVINNSLCLCVCVGGWVPPPCLPKADQSCKFPLFFLPFFQVGQTEHLCVFGKREESVRATSFVAESFVNYSLLCYPSLVFLDTTVQILKVFYELTLALCFVALVCRILALLSRYSLRSSPSLLMLRARKRSSWTLSFSAGDQDAKRDRKRVEELVSEPGFLIKKLSVKKIFSVQNCFAYESLFKFFNSRKIRMFLQIQQIS